MENLAIYSLLGWKMIILPLLIKTLIHSLSNGWVNVPVVEKQLVSWFDVTLGKNTNSVISVDHHDWKRWGCQVSKQNERTRNRQTDKKTERRKDRAMDNEADRQNDGQRYRQTDGQWNGQTDGQRDRQTDGQRNGQTDGQQDRQTDGQRDRQTDGQRNRRSVCETNWQKRMESEGNKIIWKETQPGSNSAVTRTFKVS